MKIDLFYDPDFSVIYSFKYWQLSVAVTSAVSICLSFWFEV